MKKVKWSFLFLMPLLVWPSWARGGDVSLKAEVRIRTEHYAMPSGDSSSVSRDIVLKKGQEFELRSDLFKIRHLFAVSDISAKAVNMKPSDLRSAGVYVHRRKRNDTRGYSFDRPRTALWEESLAKDEELILVEPGISDAGVRWYITLNEISSKLVQRDMPLMEEPIPAYESIVRFEKGKKLQFPDFAIEYIREEQIAGPNRAPWGIQKKRFQVSGRYGMQEVVWVRGGDIGPSYFQYGSKMYMLELLSSGREPYQRLGDHELVISPVAEETAARLFPKYVVRGTIIVDAPPSKEVSPIQKLKITKWLKGRGPSSIDVDISKTTWLRNVEGEYSLQKTDDGKWILLDLLKIRP